jgi:hypothetical protein
MKDTLPEVIQFLRQGVSKEFTDKMVDVMVCDKDLLVRWMKACPKDLKAANWCDILDEVADIVIKEDVAQTFVEACKKDLKLREGKSDEDLKQIGKMLAESLCQHEKWKDLWMSLSCGEARAQTVVHFFREQAQQLRDGRPPMTAGDPAQGDCDILLTRLNCTPQA